MKIENIRSIPYNSFRGLFDPNILITGGTGYIGSHLVPKLAYEGYNCVICGRNNDKQEYLKNVVNNLNKTKVNKSMCSFVNLDLINEQDIDKLLKNHYPIDAVIHLGGATYNGESVKNPKKYYENNVLASKNLIDSILSNDINKILYISTASIYAGKETGRASEKRIPAPKTPYAKTKFITEMLINDYKVYNLNSIILRLFNVAGASSLNDLDIGKNVVSYLLQVIKNDGMFTLLGNNYPTKDGTCIKDFIHIDDVVDAISKSIKKMLNTKDVYSSTFNVGTGNGTSLGELINKSINLTGRNLNLRISDNLADEVPMLVANNSKIKRELNWIPKKNVEDIILSCWNWIIKNGGK